VKALADFFTDDAEYTAEDGRAFKGGAEIEETIRAALLAKKGGNIAINVDSVRVLAPEVLVEKRATTVTAKNGDVSESLYTAIHVKKGRQVEDQPARRVADAGGDAARSAGGARVAGWRMGGSRQDKAGDLTVHSQYQWARR
jgi:uncharacterized protein (TIGR02246 family)